VTSPRMDNNKPKTRLKDSLKLEERRTNHLPLPEDKVTDLEEIDPEEIDLPDKTETNPENPEEIDPLELMERSENLIPTDPLEKIELLEKIDLPEKDESLERTEDPEKIDLPEKERKIEVPSTELFEKIETRKSLSEITKMLPTMESEASALMIASLELEDPPRRTRREVLEPETGDPRLTLKRNWLPSKEPSRTKLLRFKLKERLLMPPLLSPRNPKRRNSLLLNSESNEKLPSLPCLLSQLPVKLVKE